MLYSLLTGTPPPNPLMMELTMHSFLIALALQTSVAVYMCCQGLPTFLKAFVTDLTGGGDPPKSKEEALARRRRQVLSLLALLVQKHKC